MAREADHIALANKNHAVLAHLSIDADRYPEWVVTVAFYKAVHVAEAVFAVCGVHSTGHENRRRNLTLPPYRLIHRDYSHLLMAPRIARYLEDADGKGYRQFTDYMSPHNVMNKLIRKRLYGVEQNALSHLSEDGRKMLLKVTTDVDCVPMPD